MIIEFIQISIIIDHINCKIGTKKSPAIAGLRFTLQILLLVLQVS